MGDIMEIEGLRKRFGAVQAVQNLSFRVKEGELFAFLGVNGAGKSTTINILCGQLAKDGGTVRIGGIDLDEDPDRIKRSLGVVFQNSVLDKDLSVRDNLKSRAALYGIRGKEFRERLEELADLLDLRSLLKRPVGKLSGGQRRRIDIARALLHRPRILILDEPTTGLDPQTRNMLWKVVGDLRRTEGMTVFLTTHYMEEPLFLRGQGGAFRHVSCPACRHRGGCGLVCGDERSVREEETPCSFCLNQIFQSFRVGQLLPCPEFLYL